MAEIPWLSSSQAVNIPCPETAFRPTLDVHITEGERGEGGGGYLQHRRPPAQTNCPPSAAPFHQDSTSPSVSPPKTSFNAYNPLPPLEWNIHIDTAPRPAVQSSTRRIPSPATHSGPNGPPPQSRSQISTAQTTALTRKNTIQHSPQWLRAGAEGGGGCIYIYLHTVTSPPQRNCCG